MHAAGTIAITLVSFLFLIGVVCSIIAVVNIHEEDQKKDYKVPTSMKAVTTICEPTEFKDVCVQSLKSVAARNQNAHLNEFVMAAIDATTIALKISLDIVVNTTKTVDQIKNPYDYMGLEDCKLLLEEGIDNLEASFAMVRGTELVKLHGRVRELLNWIYAVYSFEMQCVDYINEPQYKSVIQDGLANATHHTSNALTIVYKIRDYLQEFKVKAEPTKNEVMDHLDNPKDEDPKDEIPKDEDPQDEDPQDDDQDNLTSRRLLFVSNQIGSRGYPTWLSAKDRKLLAGSPEGPNAVVSLDGSGTFKTIAQAINAYPEKFKGRYTIYVKAGIYRESVRITRNQSNIFIYGDGVGKTIITGNRNFGIMKINIMNTATFACDAPGFIARGLTIQNMAGPEGRQAVALRLKGDMSAVFDCQIEGYENTLYYHQYRQFYRNCIISGTIDFLFGEGAAVVQNSLIIVRKPILNQNINTVTSDGRQKKEAVTGIVLQNCRIVPERALFLDRFKILTYLGRPWKTFANTIIMQSELGDFIRPEGYLTWEGLNNAHTCNYLEYANNGPGAVFDRRVRWEGVRAITKQEATQYTPDNFLAGPTWLPKTGSPFQPGL